MKYGIQMSLRQLEEDPSAAVIVDEFMPGLRELAAKNPMAAGLSIRDAAVYSRSEAFQTTLLELDKALKTYGANAGLTETEKRKVECYRKIAQSDLQKASQKQSHNKRIYNEFYPGKLWTDTEGKRIHAHGGAVFYEDGIYYWYGENKEHTDGKNGIWTWGIRVYRSEDLYNWEDLGLMIKPNLENPDSCLFPDKRIDRPHIRKCKATGKYVAWLKLCGNDACFLVMQADRFLGPYTTVREDYRPLDYPAGDFDIAQDENSGKAYLYMAVNSKGVVGMEMADDMLSVERQISLQYTNLFPPFCREGLAVFERNGKKYLLSSGMTGYLPNQSDSAISDKWSAPFKSLGDPYAVDVTMSSFNSQFTQVFKLPDRDYYIALSDRWVPGCPIDKEKADMIRRCTASRYDPQHYTASPEEMTAYGKLPILETAPTCDADYVWLPIRFEEDRIIIEWADAWRID